MFFLNMSIYARRMGLTSLNENIENKDDTLDRRGQALGGCGTGDRLCTFPVVTNGYRK